MKCFLCCGEYGDLSRSREGAWIEISIRPYDHKYSKVAPARERGLKLDLIIMKQILFMVAPARERGLK